MLIRMAYKEFISEKDYENLSANTLKGYEMLFKDFLSWCEGNEYQRVEELTSRTIKNYLKDCKKIKNNNPTSINTKRKQFRAFFNFLISEDIIESNPTDNIKRVIEDIKIKTFTDQEVKEILSHLRRMRRREDSFYATRGHAIFLSLIGTGLRAGELVSLKWSQVDLKRKSVVVFGKMRVEEPVPLSGAMVEELRHWQGYCMQTFGKLPESVFVTQKGTPLTVNGLKCWFQRIAEKMDFPETRCSAHSCRHYFAKCWIQNGGDISTLAKVLRHSSIKTTERYLHFWGNEVADDNEKFSPLNGMNL